MARVRLAATAALMLVLALGGAAHRAPEAVPRIGDAAPAAAVTWPPSASLLVAEVVTGGASASDEYVELTNAGPSDVDLAGLEVVYVTSSGATVTRKASWASSLVIEPGRHLLLANSLGAWAVQADATYSGGLAATGGTIVLRVIGGAVIDAVGWGDASNGFVEGSAAAAPAPGSSIERLSGGAAGNTTDTNDNAADFVVNADPAAQNLASDPVPGPTPAPTVSPTPAPTVAPTPSPTSSPTPSPTPTPSPSPTPTPTPSPTPSPEPSPTPSPEPSPTPSPEPSPTSSPEPTSTPAPTPSASAAPTATPTPVSATEIAAVRELPDGAGATVEGTLTTDLGALESGRTGFVQDDTAGIALYLDAALPLPIPAGSRIRVGGVVDSRYGQRTLRIVGADVEVLGTDVVPLAVPVVTGEAGEPLEGMRLELGGAVTETPTALSDGLGLYVDDGTGSVRVIVAAPALGSLTPSAGSRVVARGPLGQRDSGGTGLAGYRLYATLPGELEVLPPEPTPTPTPSPTPTASPTPSPTPVPTATPSATPAPSPTPSPSPAPSATPAPTSSATPTPSPAPTATPMDVATARSVPVGGSATVRGVVIAEAGRLGTPPLMAIGDATGGLPVRLPEGVVAPPRGKLIEVRGTIANPYGQTELRVATGGLAVLGAGTMPVALPMDAGDAGEATEGRLATVRGAITESASRATSGDIAFTITGEDGRTLRVYADASAKLDPASLRKGLTASFTGIVGQRATRKGALDGYRLWLRDPGDIAAVAGPGSSPSPSASVRPTPAPGTVVTIAAARVRDGSRVTVVGVLTIDRTLLDASGRRTVVEDATGAIELYLATPDPWLRAGAVVQATGVVGTAYGAARLRVEDIAVTSRRTPVVRELHAPPATSDEWRLVRLAGTVIDVHRLGDRWLAELDLGSARVPVNGLAGSGIPSTILVEGMKATVTGIVRRPYPTATDRRFSIVPRNRDDLVLGPAPGASSRTSAAGGAGGASSSGDTATGAGGPATGDIPDVDLARLADHVGRTVRVGGLVADLEPDGILLDDGTATGRVVLTGEAAALLPMLEPGDALNATGSVEMREVAVLVTADPAALVLVGNPGGTTPDAGPSEPTASTPVDGIAVRAGVGGAPGLDSATMGLGTLMLVSAMSVLVTLARRHRGRRLLQARVMERLEGLARARTEAPGDVRTPSP